jgi:ATP-dependent DNA helicase RecG
MQTYVSPLINEQLLAMTIPDKPKSKYQKYVTTPKGLEELI